MTHAQVLTIIRKAADQFGSQAGLAKDMGISRAYLTDILYGRRSLSDRVLDYFGLLRETKVTYKKKVGQ